jgi:hypothetical protein
VPIGPDNSFNIGGADQGQPTHFLPRRNRFVFRVRVPDGFGEKNELIWTLTTHGKTEKAYASLRPDYVVDDVVRASETGALGAGTSSPEVRANKAPSVHIEELKTRSVKVGEAITLVSEVKDDGIPKPRDPARVAAAQARAAAQSTTSSSGSSAAAGAAATPPRASPSARRSAFMCPGSCTADPARSPSIHPRSSPGKTRVPAPIPRGRRSGPRRSCRRTAGRKCTSPSTCPGPTCCDAAPTMARSWQTRTSPSPSCVETISADRRCAIRNGCVRIGHLLKETYPPCAGIASYP